MSITQLPPLSLYIHFPWCVQKCPYCDFNSHTAKQNMSDIDYVDALLDDLEQELPSVWGRSITSIFIGGGTPSLMSVAAMDKLLSGVRARLPFLSDIEVTMEANPGTVEAEKFSGFLGAGINRISIGVQSFNDKHLKILGRIHHADEAKRAFEIARNAGCNNINLDLMYALPDQTIDQALSDLQIATALAPDHLSWYQLTLEPNTPFYHQPPQQMASDDHLADIGELGLKYLANHDYQRYEVSAFSRSGQYPAWHNSNYWQFGDYIGIGAGAHGKITRADTQQIIRTSKRRNPKDYLNSSKSYIDNTRILTQQELPLEFMMNAMRLNNGVDENLFFQTTGLLFSHLSPAINRCVDRGLMIHQNSKIYPSKTGFRFLNELLSEFSEQNFPKLNSLTTINIKAL
jgi:putative oxygen-independent coproporphyrinogen III oxidase